MNTIFSFYCCKVNTPFINFSKHSACQKCMTSKIHKQDQTLYCKLLFFIRTNFFFSKINVHCYSNFYHNNFFLCSTLFYFVKFAWIKFFYVLLFPIRHCSAMISRRLHSERYKIYQITKILFFLICFFFLSFFSIPMNSGIFYCFPFIGCMFWSKKKENTKK
jgi:hypothetical protein